MKVRIEEDIPLRTTGDGTWVEAGKYKVLRDLGKGRYLIILRQLNKERTLTIVNQMEVEVI